MTGFATKWIDEWPTEPGWYWCNYKSRMHKDSDWQLEPVKVVRISNGVSYICFGNFMYKTETAEAFWTPIDPPVPLHDVGSK